MPELLGFQDSAAPTSFLFAFRQEADFLPQSDRGSPSYASPIWQGKSAGSVPSFPVFFAECALSSAAKPIAIVTKVIFTYVVKLGVAQVADSVGDGVKSRDLPLVH